LRQLIGQLENSISSQSENDLTRLKGIATILLRGILPPNSFDSQNDLTRLKGIATLIE